MVKVSVIIPVYNSGRYIGECLESIYNQTLKDIEVIIVNDGSTDRSLRVIKEMAKGHSNTTIIDIPNSGVAHARNVALDIASGEYIKFIDSDDTLACSTTLEDMYNSAIKNEADTVVGLYYTYAFFRGIDLKDSFNCSGYHEGSLINPLEDKKFVFDEMPNVGNKLFSRKLIGDLRFPEKLNWEDLAVVPAFMAGSEKIFFTNEVACNYRMHFNTSVKNALFSHNIFEVFPILESLKSNMGSYGVYEEFQSELKGMYALHTALKATNVLSWVDMPRKEKIKLIRLFMNYVELEEPDYLSEETLIKYFETHPFFNHQFERVQGILDGYQRIDDVRLLQEEVGRTFQKTR